MKKISRTQRSFLMTALLMLLMLLAACAQATPATTTAPATSSETSVATTTEESTTEEATSTNESLFPLTITDAIGQEFTFDAPPKIGCWWSGCAEILADLGVVEHAGALAVEGDAESPFFYPVGRPTNPIADSSNPEDWAAAEVDIVIMRVPDADWLSAVKEAAPIFFLHHPSYGESSQTSYEAYRENLRIVRQLTDRQEAAEAAIARFDNTLANLKQISTPETAELVTAFLWESDAYRAIDGTNPLCQIIVEVGLGNCIDTPMWDEINPEAFLSIDPDLIVFMNNLGTYTERTDPIWPQLTAVKEGRIYGGEGYYYCCGARTMIYSLQEYAHYLLPDAVPDPGPMADFVVEESPLTQPVATSDGGASASTAAANFPVTIEHVHGSTTITEFPQRIVTVGLLDHDVLIALGIVPVGTTEWFNGYPGALWPWASDKLNGADMPTVVGDGTSINFEGITALQPDLILALYASVSADDYALLSQIAPTVVRPEGYVDYGVPWQEMTRIIGQSVGKAQEAEELITGIDQLFEQVRAEHPEFVGASSIVATPYEGIWVYGPEDVRGRLLTTLGFELPEGLAEVTGTEFGGNLSAERAEMLDVDVIIWLDADDADGALGGPLYATLPVHTEGREVFLDSFDDPLGGATSFVTVLSIPYLLEGLVPQLAEALEGVN